MRLGAQERELLRRMVEEEVRRHLSAEPGHSARERAPSVRPVPLIQGVPPLPQPPPPPAQQKSPAQSPSLPLSHGSGARHGPAQTSQPPGPPQAAQQAGDTADQQGLSRAAHALADTQVQVARALESSLRQLDDLIVQAEAAAEKIRSILRRTEPSREQTRPGGP